MEFLNSYARLDEIFYQRTQPVPVIDPKIFLWNKTLADELLIAEDQELSNEHLAQVFSGNTLLPGSEPIAMAYAGHQFGNFVPQLGDGRAHLLGVVLD